MADPLLEDDELSGDVGLDSDIQLGSSLTKIRENAPTLKTLDLRYRNLSPNSIIDLARALVNNTHLTALHLSGNDIKDEGAKHIAEALRVNTALQSLDLKFTEIGDEGATALRDALIARTKGIKELSLLGNLITSKLASEIETIIKHPPQQPAAKPKDSTQIPPIPTTTAPTETKEEEFSEKQIRERFKDDPETMNFAVRMQKRIVQLEEMEAVFKAKIDALERKNSGGGDYSLSETRIMTINCKNIQINEKISESGGSTAGVYSCLVDGWHCIMKELDMKGVSSVLLKQFDREITILEQLAFHPNIVRYLFHEKKKDKMRLYMTRYSCSLRQIITKRALEIDEKRNDMWSPREVVRFCADIASGLEFLHKNQVIHRDLKSANIFVNLDVHQEPSLLAIGDFDTAKRISGSSKANTIIGTPAYMAPEVIKSQTAGTYTFKADIWSFGMLLFELLTLNLPYQGEDLFEVPRLIAGGKRPKFPESWPHAERFKDLLQLFNDCTILEPEKRPDAKTLKAKLYELHWNQES